MAVNLYSKNYKKFIGAGLVLVVIITVGTIGYWFIGGKKYSFVDCLYMTVITVATIGYGEIVDMSHNPAGRIFTMFIAVSGIGAATYILTNLTAFMVEGEMSEAFRRRKMEKMIGRLKGHYIVCGVEGVGFHVLTELSETKRPYVAVDIKKEKIDRALEAFREQLYIEGDATDSDTLLAAGIKRANGLFAVTGDDNQNLVISLTAKQLNPDIRVVARCWDLKNMDKMKKAGADAVVSPTFIGGLRMASEMVRSTVVSFLDTMLRDREKNLRIEELPVPDSLVEKPVSDMCLKEHPNTLLLAVRTEGDWAYNPPAGYVLKSGDTLIFMTTPEERDKLAAVFCRKEE
ncbi:MAG TPA: potassium channel protein [Thermodesulfovibrionales bacterium]|nr:potassium channel protein [Thermodesulfovibrionales bacterium]